MSRLLALLLLGAFGASTAEAQTLVLCDADWMDVERVLALITVEVDEPPRYVFRVTDCTEESAHVAVSGPNGLAREREVRLASTAPEARSRLVALVLVELVRLGTREPAEAVPASGDPEPVADSAEPTPASESAEPTPVAESAEPIPDSDSDEPNVDPEDGPSPLADPEAFGRFETAEAVDSPTEVARAAPSPAATTPVDSCGGGGLAGRLSARGCSSTLGVGIGLARHQLQQGQRIGALWAFQLRARYRWRFLLVGIRAAGRLSRMHDDSGSRVRVGGYTAHLGFEVASVGFDRALLAFALYGEGGIVRYDAQRGGAACADIDGFFPTRCGVEPQSGIRPTYGALASIRLEIPVRRGALAFELEGGWTRGLMITSSSDPVSGIGGAQLSLVMEAAFGLGGAS